ncbi:T9SS type A sorting domain-containing protein [Chryseobacterium caseinilyticum]|uniref:T9SS type A sorting domain-containing protein n=1 Tax=Chryseobacterium caseinilyticum TaxID=2771428 RepID=A0ABR8ZCB9_9FLAO|nr:T9SS type A sorting domain-containing protein [Chryseobacterium caseinilyticum]MBD8082891.1 T9SS type A sorting domain-containing protein [Chryseobacterium caseinilyticum]
MKIFYTLKLIPLFVLSGIGLQAQKAVLATGTNATGSNGSVSYSVGQIDFNQKGSGLPMMEGVQQSYEIITLSVNSAIANTEDIRLYPNPFQDFIYLDFPVKDYKDAEFQLFDSSGKLLRTEKIQNSKSEFNFSSLPSAMYLFNIVEKGKGIKSFKIIKK